MTRRTLAWLAVLGLTLATAQVQAQTPPVHEISLPNGPAPNNGPVPPSALTCLNGDSGVARATIPAFSSSGAFVARASCPLPVAGDALDGRVRDVRIQSVALNGIAWARVILPPSYDDAASAQRTYPVLYLLTGNGAGFQSWTCNTLVQEYVRDAEVIVVMPDGSRRYNPCDSSDKINNAIPGWYADWWQRSLDNNPERWETFHLKELKLIMETSFRSNNVYAVAGLSMGGYGAMYYATRNDPFSNPPKRMFKAVASYSGLLNTVSSSGFTAVTGSLTLAGQSTDAVWGYYPGTPGAYLFGTRWPTHNPTNLMSSFVPANNQGGPTTMPIFFSVGDGFQGPLEASYDAGAGAIELGARYTNQDFLGTMISANGGTLPTNVEYAFHPGTHNWRVWDAALCRSLPMLMENLLDPDHVQATPSFTQPANLPCNDLFNR